jgi:hypothetical protein
MFTDIWVFPYKEEQHDKFRTGKLWQEWARQYPDIFDTDDARLAQSQAAHGYHFFEWLAAILIFQSTGYLSLVEKYEFSNHQRKHEILKKLVMDDVFKLITDKTSKAQNPDLLVYSPSLTDWFFCEVKGRKDRLRQVQKDYFAELENISGKQVYVIQFKLL